MLNNKSHAFYQKSVKVGRVDLGRNEWFERLHPNLKTLPNWVMYVKGSPYYIQNFHMVNRFVQAMQRLLFPYQILSSVREIESFIAYTKNDISGRILVRNKVLGLFSEPDDYEERIEEFKEVALKSYWRADTMYGLVLKNSVALDLFAKYGPKYFPNKYDKNNVLLYKMKNRFSKKELVVHFNFDKERDMATWLAKSAISPLEELTANNQMSFSTKSPLLVAFVDPQAESTTQAYLDELEHLGTKYINRVNFVWVEIISLI